MGPTAAIIAASTGIAAGAQIGGGLSGLGAARNEASALGVQSQAAQQDTQNLINQKVREVNQVQASQGEAYLSSGVTLQGTPITVMQDTAQRGQQEVDALEQRKAAINNLYQQRMAQTVNEGRTRFLAGLAGAASTGLEGYLKLQTANTKLKPGAGMVSSGGSGSVGNAQPLGPVPSFDPNGKILPPI